MLIKEKDGIGPQLEALQSLLRAAKTSVTQQDQIQDEIKRLKAGAQGEENAAYHIDFKLRDSKKKLRRPPRSTPGIRK